MNLGNIVGNLIISPPAIKDNFWYKTVIMIVEHYNYGSMGLILNKKSEITINELCDKLGLDADMPGFVYTGGPVNLGVLSLIHTNDWNCSKTLRINDKFSLTSSKDMVPRIASGDLPKKWRLINGMCQWASGQLYSELYGIPPYTHNTSWCTTYSDLSLVFDYDKKSQWHQALEKSAEDFAKSIAL